MTFEPDYTHFENVLQNQRPQRLPLYEHIISPNVMEKVLDTKFVELIGGTESDLEEFFTHYCRFFKEMTYDVVSFEYCITTVMPDSGAILGGKPGPVQNRQDFDKYPWDEIPNRFWKKAKPQFDALVAVLPEGMKAIGGVGNGVFEISEDLVGLEMLPFMMADDPELYGMVYNKIGDTMAAIWKRFLKEYSEYFVGCRFGDDLGFKSSLLTNPATVRNQIIPQYKKVIDLVHAAGRPFLWHSCGCIFQVMEDAIAIGIDAKHSNEDAIAPFDRWIQLYGERIGLLGGFDMDFICQQTPDEIFDNVVEQGQRFRKNAKGYALGSGNSIPDYVPVENYLAMVKGAQRIRELENTW
jgi:uroporphyrinogen decarboxylase